MKKLLALLLSVALAVGLLPAFAAAEQTAAGDCGAQGAAVTWTLDGAGTLTVSGAGAMRDYAWGASPWFGSDAVRAVKIARGVTSVGAYAFYGCASLRRVSLPYGVSSVGAYAFCGCGSLAAVSLPDSVTTLGDGAFYDCVSLRQAGLSAGLTALPNYAFYGCAGLTALSLPEKLSAVGASAFSGCAGVTGVIVPDGVTEIGADAFPAQAMLYGGEGSAAQRWANGNGRAFAVTGGTKLTLTAPAFVSEAVVSVCGFADPGAQVTCYVNDARAAVAAASAEGKWNASLALPVSADGDIAAVRVSVTAGDKTVSRAASVQYRPDAPAFRALTMEHNYYTVTVTESDRNAARPNITLSPDRPFSFRVSVANSDRIARLAVCSTRNGVAKTIPLTYDAGGDEWFGSGWFDNADHAYVPGPLTVEGTDKDGGDIGTGLSLSLNFLTEPAGYVYEAVRSNKVAGAAAAVYYKDESGRVLLWNAAASEQINPAITLPDGSFTWAVPRGTWQIRVSKAGYQSAASEWMTVPPGSDQVFLPLVTTQAPAVESLNVYADRAELVFSSYMEIGSVNADTVRFSGYAVEVAPLDAEETEAGSGVFYARSFRITPDIPFAGMVEVAVGGAKNYAGMAMAEDYSAAADVTEEPARFTATDAVALACDGAAQITLSAENAAGKTVSATVGSGIAALSDDTLTLDENGTAALTVTGLLPGETQVVFRLAGTALTANTAVTVAPYREVIRPAGDVDGDGEVTPADARLALRIAVKLDACEAGSEVFIAADVTGDGEIGPDDARLILRAAVGLETL